jgi:hypothetical protein
MSAFTGWILDELRNQYYYYDVEQGAYIYQSGERIFVDPPDTNAADQGQPRHQPNPAPSVYDQARGEGIMPSPGWSLDPGRGEGYQFSPTRATFVYQSGYRTTVAPQPPLDYTTFKCAVPREWLTRGYGPDQMRRFLSRKYQGQVPRDLWDKPLHLSIVEG